MCKESFRQHDAIPESNFEIVYDVEFFKRICCDFVPTEHKHCNLQETNLINCWQELLLLMQDYLTTITLIKIFPSWTPPVLLLNKYQKLTVVLCWLNCQWWWWYSDIHISKRTDAFKSSILLPSTTSRSIRMFCGHRTP